MCKATGIITDIMDEILKVLDIQGKIKLRYVAFNKNKDMIKALNSGKIDVAFPVEDNVSLADKNKIFLTSSVITTSMNLAFKEIMMRVILKQLLSEKEIHFKKNIHALIIPMQKYCIMIHLKNHLMQ